MSIKSILLGAAAGIASIGGAQAADLPMTKGEAVEYVKICTEFGAGFFYIPGSDTCLKISGEVRADYQFAGYDSQDPKFGRVADNVGFKTRGKISFDARTTTEYGALRSFFTILGKTGFGGASTFEVDRAFIQFGGLTAGYAHSFFGIYDNEYGNTIFAGYAANSNVTNLLAYTAVFGGGFTATLAVEDGLDARAKNVLFSDTGVGSVAGYGGLSAPDLVGQLRVEQSWGKAAAFAAVHQLRSSGAVDPIYDTKYGYAVGGALAFNLPVAAGGHIVVEANYEKGAASYLNVGTTSDWVQDSTLNTNLSHGWSVVGEAGVNVTPKLAITAFGSYADIKVSDLDGLGPVGTSDASFKQWVAGANAWYTVTKGFSVGAEISYSDQNYKSALVESGATLNDVKSWSGGLRAKRNF